MVPLLDRRQESNLETLKRLSEGLLRSAGRTGVKGNLLEIHHASAPLFDPVFLHSHSEIYGLSVSLCQEETGGTDQKVRCRTDLLPFQDNSFQMVVLHHVISDGKQEELAEAVRVLARNGVLILLGLNHLGWRFMTQDRIRRLPGLAPLRVKSCLEDLDMEMQGFAGAGLGGMKWPAWMYDGLGSVGAPLADLVILQARHASGPEVTPLRFRKSGAGVVQSAPLGG